jgi:hypothetical protein
MTDHSGRRGIALDKLVTSVPNGPVGQVLSYGPVGQPISEGWTRPDQISWSSQVGHCFGLVRPGFVLQSRKLSIRASPRTCANSFLLLMVKCPVPARKTLSLWRDKSLHSLSLAYIPARCMFVGSWVPPTGVPSGGQGGGSLLEGLFLFLSP